VTSLAELDVQQSLAQTIETLTRAAGEVAEAISAAGSKLSEEARAKLDLIGKKVEEAEAYYARALDSKPLYDRLTDIHSKVGDAPGAERYARQGRRFLSDELEFKGRKQAFYGNHTKALDLFDQALKLTPDHDFALSGAEASRKRIERSRKDLEKLQKAAETKNTPKERIALGSAFADLGKLDEAQGQFERAIALDANNPDAWARKGTMLHAKGDVQQALEMYKKATAIKPTSMVGRRGVNYATFDLEHPPG
jgi:tetratricopeptide (TPR) repeat protein